MTNYVAFLCIENYTLYKKNCRTSGKKDGEMNTEEAEKCDKSHNVNSEYEKRSLKTSNLSNIIASESLFFLIFLENDLYFVLIHII